jgi:hypothetical protein
LEVVSSWILERCHSIKSSNFNIETIASLTDVSV